MLFKKNKDVFVKHECPLKAAYKKWEMWPWPLSDDIEGLINWCVLINFIIVTSKQLGVLCNVKLSDKCELELWPWP